MIVEAATTALCSECGDALAGVAVLWHAAAGELHLHAECAQRLGVHFIADAREARLSSGQPPWARRAAQAAGRALRAQEQAPQPEAAT